MSLLYTQPRTKEENNRESISVLIHKLYIYYVITLSLESYFLEVLAPYTKLNNLVADKTKFYTTEIPSLAVRPQGHTTRGVQTTNSINS